MHSDSLAVVKLFFLSGEQILVKVKELELLFMDMTIAMYYRLKEKNTTGLRLVSRLFSCAIHCKDENRDFINRLKVEFVQTWTFDEVWEKLCNEWNFLSFLLLELVSRLLGSYDDKQRMFVYQGRLKAFAKCTLLVDFLKYCPVLEEKLQKVDLREIVKNHKLDWETCTLAQFNNMRNTEIHDYLLPIVHNPDKFPPES